MNYDEKIRLLARAILELADKAAVEWDYDGEQMHGTGVLLNDKSKLEEIIEKQL